MTSYRLALRLVLQAVRDPDASVQHPGTIPGTSTSLQTGALVCLCGGHMWAVRVVGIEGLNRPLRAMNTRVPENHTILLASLPLPPTIHCSPSAEPGTGADAVGQQR